MYMCKTDDTILLTQQTTFPIFYEQVELPLIMFSKHLVGHSFNVFLIFTVRSNITIFFFAKLNVLLMFVHSNAGLFQPKLGSNVDKPKCWVKNLI